MVFLAFPQPMDGATSCNDFFRALCAAGSGQEFKVSAAAHVLCYPLINARKALQHMSVSSSSSSSSSQHLPLSLRTLRCSTVAQLAGPGSKDTALVVSHLGKPLVLNATFGQLCSLL
jgi:hypothetical protein